MAWNIQKYVKQPTAQFPYGSAEDHIYYSKKIDSDRFDFLDNYFQTAYGYCHISGYTYSNLVAKNKEEIEKLINGLSKAEQVNKNQQAPVPPPQVYK